MRQFAEARVCGSDLPQERIALMVLLWVAALLVLLAANLDYFEVDDADSNLWDDDDTVVTIFTSSCDDSSTLCASFVGFSGAAAFSVIAAILSIPWATCCCKQGDSRRSAAESGLRMATAISSTVTLIFVSIAWFPTFHFIDHGTYLEGFYLVGVAFLVALTNTVLAWRVYVYRE